MGDDDASTVVCFRALVPGLGVHGILDLHKDLNILTFTSSHVIRRQSRSVYA